MISKRSSSKYKQSPISNKKNIKHSLVKTQRRSPSNRSQKTPKDIGFLTIDSFGACSSRHPTNNTKKVFVFAKSHQPHWEQSMNDLYGYNQNKPKNQKKQGKLLNSDKINASAQSLVATPKATRRQNYEKQLLTVGSKKQKGKFSKLALKANQTMSNKGNSQQGENCKLALEKKERPAIIQNQCQENRKRVGLIERQGNGIQVADYLVREATEASEQVKEGLETIKQPAETNGNEYSSLKDLISQPQKMKGQLQRSHEQTIAQLKAANCKLQEQMLDLYRKSEAARGKHNQQVLQIQRISLGKFDTVTQQCNRIKSELKLLQDRCQLLQSQKQVQTQHSKEELARQARVWEQEKAMLQMSVSNTEVKFRQLLLLAEKFERQNKELQDQVKRMSLQKQQLQEVAHTFEAEVKELEGKLGNEIRKSKDSLKQLDALRQEKAYIKESSQFVLHVIRQQIRELKMPDGPMDQSSKMEAIGDKASSKKKCVLQQMSQ